MLIEKLHQLDFAREVRVRLFSLLFVVENFQEINTHTPGTNKPCIKKIHKSWVGLFDNRLHYFLYDDTDSGL